MRLYPQNPKSYWELAIEDSRLKKPGDLTLRLLVLRCQTGDENAFRDLFDLYSGRTRRFAETLLDAETAEDVQQEVWISIYKRIGQLTDPGAFRTWLYMTTRHAAIDWLRRRKREAEILSMLAAEPTTVSFQDEGHSEISENAVTRSAVASLPAAQREVVVLRYWDDMSYAEIALVVGSSIGTVRSRLHYARRALGKVLQDSGLIEGDGYECQIRSQTR